MIEPVQLIVPTIATIALGSALLLPIRDSRHGRRATLGGRTPLHTDFRAVAPQAASANPGSDIDLGTEATLKGEVSQQDALPGVEQTTPLEFTTAESKPHTGPFEGPIAHAPPPQQTRPQQSRGSAPSSEEPLQGPVAIDIDRLRGRFAQTFGAAVRAALTWLGAPVLPRSIERPADLETSDCVVERSFADELSRLIPLPSAESDIDTTSMSAAMPDAMITGAPPESQGEDDMPQAPETRNDVPGAAPDGGPPEEVQARRSPRAVPVEIRSVASRNDRVVPLTRLPLRRQTQEILWVGQVPALHASTDDQRYAFLRTCAVQPGTATSALLAQAFREEQPQGRALALAAMRRIPMSRETIATFVEALHTGNDDERSLALDALSEAGARDEVALGLSDRVDAIAAKAALAYVGTTAREDYRLALAPFLDDARIESILGLLAGVVE